MEGTKTLMISRGLVLRLEHEGGGESVLSCRGQGLEGGDGLLVARRVLEGEAIMIQRALIGAEVLAVDISQTLMAGGPLRAREIPLKSKAEQLREAIPVLHSWQ